MVTCLYAKSSFSCIWYLIIGMDCWLCISKLMCFSSDTWLCCQVHHPSKPSLGELIEMLWAMFADLCGSYEVKLVLKLCGRSCISVPIFDFGAWDHRYAYCRSIPQRDAVSYIPAEPCDEWLAVTATACTRLAVTATILGSFCSPVRWSPTCTASRITNGRYKCAR